MTRLPVWLTPHQKAGARFEANAYPDPARDAVEREPDLAACFGIAYTDEQMAAWRASWLLWQEKFGKGKRSRVA